MKKLLRAFYAFDVVHVKNSAFFKIIDETLLGQRIERDMLPEKLEEEYLGKRITKDLLAKFKESGVKRLSLRKRAY